MSAVKRATRVAERLRQELSTVLRAMRDPRIEGALISRVELTDDLQSARVLVRCGPTVGEEEQARKMALLKALTAASGRLRRDVGHALDLRYAPTLRFYYDDGVDASQRIEELLREVERDREP